MTKPDLETNAGIYHLTWKNEQVTIHLDRITESKNYMISGEVIVKTTLPGVPSHIHQGRLSLTSTDSRNKLARYLTERAPGLAWADMLEQTCVLVLNRHRQGEPIINLASYEASDRLEYRLAPFLLEGQVSLIFGPGAVGKSMFADYLAVLANTPASENGFEPEPSHVLYLDYETSEDEIEKRISMIARGLNIPKPPILYRFCHQPIAVDVHELQRTVVNEGIDVIIIDSAGLACGSDPESAESTLALFRALRSLRKCALVLAHVAKNPLEKTAFGSVYWQNMARTVWEMKKAQATEENKLHIGLYHKKSNSGQLLKPIGLELTFTEGIVQFKRKDLTEVDELADTLPLKDRMVKVLLKGPQSVDYLAELFNTSEGTIRSTGNRYKQTFLRLPDGNWAVRVSNDEKDNIE